MSKNNQKRRAFFDLDGVLVDDRKRTIALLNKLVKCPDVANEENLQMLRNGDFSRQVLRKQLHWGDDMINNFRRQFMQQGCGSEYAGMDSLFSGVRVVLEDLRSRGYEIVLCASKFEYRDVKGLLCRFGIEDCFDHIAAVGFAKEKFLKEHFKPFSRYDILLCSNIQDVKIGLGLKVVTIAVCYGFVSKMKFKEYEPDFFLTDFRQLTEWVKLIMDENVARTIQAIEATQGQHYVPNHFLKEWQCHGSAMWIRDAEGTHRKSSDDVAKESKIYAFEDVTVDELMVMLPVLREAAKTSQLSVANAFVDMAISTTILYEVAYNKIQVSDVFRLAKTAKDKGLLGDAILSTIEMMGVLKALGEDVNYLKRGLRRRYVEGYEPVMCEVESAAFPILDAIRNGDCSFKCDSEKVADFARYLAFQMLRTRKFTTLIKVRPELTGKVMRLLRPIYAEMTARGIFRDWGKTIFMVVENKTELEFITGDQPLANLAQHKKPKYFDLYFPISPRKAIFMCDKGRESLYPELSALTVKDVHALNQKICEECVFQVYASEEMILKVGGYRAQYDIDGFKAGQKNQ